MIRFVLSLALVMPGIAEAQKAPTLAAPTSAQVDIARCDRLARAIDVAEMSIAITRADAFLDDSAPRETVRQLKAMTLLQAAQMNLTIMVAIHCPTLPDAPMADGARYAHNAGLCVKAVRDSAAAGQRTGSPECIKANWAPTPGLAQ